MKRYTTQPGNKLFSVGAAVIEKEAQAGVRVTFSNLVNFESIERIRNRLPQGQRPTFTAFIAKAAAQALKEFPFANRRAYRPFGFLPHRFQNFSSVDISVAAEVNIPDREYVAFFDILRDTEKKSFSETSAWLRDFRNDIDNNPQWKSFHAIMQNVPKLLAQWLIRLPYAFPRMWHKYRGGAVMISSPAKYGVDSVVAAWPSPIGLSYGLVKPRPIVDKGQLRAATTCHVVMVFDRRLMAGAPAARVFQRLVEILENMEQVFKDDPLIAGTRKKDTLAPPLLTTPVQNETPQ
ncbi:MAG: 2-oxo acid dehydrogenase subunit E2 [Bdellovibrionaceae bacterium]|nr:2-oxo acid dehydrogenase subunit E2 [Pseudobdellovibrionaceae bacterium]